MVGWVFVLFVFSLSSHSSQNDGSPHILQFEIPPPPLALGLSTQVVYPPIKGADCTLQSLPEGLGGS